METESMSFKLTKTPKSRISEFDPNNIVFGAMFTDHMLVADYENGAWKTPEIMPYGKMEFTPALSSIHYGQSIFEGMKAFKSENDEVFMFRPLENFKRFNRSAEKE